MQAATSTPQAAAARTVAPTRPARKPSQTASKPKAKTARKAPAAKTASKPRAPKNGAQRVQGFLDAAQACLRQPAPHSGELRFGIDLGTATIVLAAVDAAGKPVYWDFSRARVVRDGVVVDFQGAVEAVRRLKADAEAALQCEVTAAGTAHPPAVPVSDCRACAFVLEQAGIDCHLLTDEVSAANALLQIREGAVVDVGGGSTGVGVFQNSTLTRLDDLAGGGHHLDLILAGALSLSIEAAEEHKRQQGAKVLHMLRPGLERVAESVRRQCQGQNPGTVHLAGGALQIPGAENVVANYLGWKVQAYRHAELITPFGIALTPLG